MLDAAWVDLDGGDWSDGANWSGGTVPVAGENVVIPDLNEGASITVGASVEVGSISVSGGAISIENGATMTVNSGGTISGDAAIEVADGELDLTGGDLTVQDSAQITVASGAAWTIGRVSTVTLNNTASVTNAGTITVAGQFQDGASSASTSYLQQSGGLYLTGPPISTTGLIDLFDPAQGVTTSGGSVTGWTNLGTGIDVLTSDNEATVVDGPNGSTMIHFNNSFNEGGLSFEASDESSLSSNGYFAFAVIRADWTVDGMGSSYPHILMAQDAQQVPLQWVQSTNEFQSKANPIATRPSFDGDTIAGSGETFVILAEILPTVQRLYVNGVIVSEVFNTVASFDFDANTIWEIGNAYTGDIGHVAIYDGSTALQYINKTGEALAGIYDVSWSRLETEVIPSRTGLDEGSAFRLGGTMVFEGGVIDGTGTIGANVIELGENVTVTTSGYTGHNGLGDLIFDASTSMTARGVFELKTSGDADRVSLISFTGTGTYDLREATGKMVSVDSPLSIGITKWVVEADNTDMLVDGVLLGSVEPIWGDGTTENPLIKVNYYNSGRVLRTRVAARDMDTYVFTGAVDNTIRDVGNWTVDGLPAANWPSPGSNIVIPEGTTVDTADIVWAFNSIVINGTFLANGAKISIRDADASSIGPNGTYTSTNGSSLSFSTGSTLSVEGTLEVGTASITTLLTPATILLGSGATLNVGSGELDLSGGLIGTGTVTAANTTIDTVLKPGGDDSAGTLSFVGDVTLSAGLTTTIDIIDSSTHDVVAVSGNIDYAGTLVLNVVGTPVLTSEDQIAFVTAATSSDLGHSVSVVGGALESLVPNGGGLTAVVTTETSLSSTLRSDLAGLQSLTRQFGSFFNLDAITGSSSPELAVLPSSLDDLFDLDAVLSSVTLPTFTASSSLTDLATTLIAAGYTIDFISGGATVGETIIPDAPEGSSSLIQIRYDVTLASGLTVDGGFAGDSFNGSTPELMQGLSDSTSLSGSIAWTASLGAALIFGVDGDGFFVSADSALVLAAAGSGTISGSGQIGNKTSVSLTGNAEADLSVRLALNTASGTYQLSELDGLLADFLAPTVSGTASVDAQFTVGGLTLDYAGDYSVTEDFAARTTDTSVSGTLTGSFALPGLTVSGTDTEATVAVTGSYDAGEGNWTLSGTFTDLDLNGLSVSSGTVSVVLDSADLSGSASMTLEPGFIGADSGQATVAISATFDADSGSITGTASLADLIVESNTGESLLIADQAELSVNLSIDFVNNELSGSIALTAEAASLSPDSSYTASLTDGEDVDSYAVEVSYDTESQVIGFTFDVLTIVAPSVFRVAVNGVSASYDRTAGSGSQTLATISDATIDVVALENASGTDPPSPSITTSQFVLRSDGFSIAEATAVLPDQSLGGFITLTAPTLTLSDFEYTQGSQPSGTLSLTAGSAALYPSSSGLTTQLSDVSGSLDPVSETFSFSAGSLTSAVGEAFQLDASSVSIAYDANGGASQTIATIGSATVTTPLIAGLDSATLSNVVLRANGMSIGSFTLEPVAEASVGIGDFVSFSGVVFEVANFDMSYDSGDVSFSGSVSLGADAVSLFPSASSFLSATLSDATIGFDFVGVNPSGDMALSASSLTVDLGEAIRVQTGAFTIAPNSSSANTISSATVSSPLVTGFNNGTVSDVQLTDTGISIGSVTLSPDEGEAVTIDDFISISGASLVVENLVIDTASDTPISGSITLSSSSVSLYPQSSIVSGALSGVTAVFDLSGSNPTGDLAISADALSLTIGDALEIAATSVVLTPGETVILTIAEATASSPMFAELESVALQDLALTQTGFSISTLSLGPEGGMTVSYDDVMTLDGVALSVSNFEYDVDSGISGDIGLSVSGLQLYPNSTAFEVSVVDPAVSIDLEGDGGLTITASAFSLRIGDALVLSATDVELTPSENTILTLASAVATSPSMSGAGQAIITDAEFTRDGFSLGSFVLGTSGQTLEFGAVNLEGAQVYADGFTFDYGTGEISGTLGISATGMQLYPGASQMESEVTGLSVEYSFDDDAWQIAASTFALQIGESLRIEASDVVITPNDEVILTVSTATVSSPSMTGLGTATLENFVVSQNGFTLGSFSFGQDPTSTSRMGDAIELTGVQLVVTNFEYEYVEGEGSIAAGGIGLSAVGLALFPDSNAFTTEVTDLAMSYDLSGNGELVITAGTFALEIGTALRLDAEDIVITPDRETILTIGTAVASSPALSGMTAELEGLVITREGFSIDALDLTPVPGATLSLGGVATLTGASIGVRDFVYTASDNQITGSIALGAQELTLFPGNSAFTAVATDIVGTFPIDGSSIGGMTLEVGNLEIEVGGLLHFSATDLVITPEGSTIVTVGDVSAALTLGSTTIAAEGGNFSILADGSFQANEGFYVGLDLSTGPAALAMPSWLGFRITELALIWPDFNGAVDEFYVRVSAEVTGIAGQSFAVTGAVSDMLIDPSLVAAGKMGIVDVGAVSVTIGGAMFGGEASGSLALGVVRLDADGNQIATGDVTTEVASSVFYGGIRATFSMGGVNGFSISIGLSELGPINVYISSGFPIILDPTSGLALTNIRGGVLFNTTIPDVTDAFELRGAAFQPQGELTDAQWLEMLEGSVVNAARAPPGEGANWDAFNQSMRMELGATLYSANASTNAFRADVDLIFDSNGKLVIAGDFTFGNSATIGGWLYTDLTSLEGGSLDMVFLADQPKDLPVFTVYGNLSIEFSRVDGQAITSENLADSVTFSLTDGGMILSALGMVEVKFSGNVEMSYSEGQLDLVFDGTVDLPLLDNALVGAGELHVVDPSSDTPTIWGAIVVEPDFSALDQLGLSLEGFAMLRINSTLSEKSVSLAVPGHEDPIEFDLPSLSAGLYVYDAKASFQQGGQDWFRIEGELSLEITPTHLEAFVIGDLFVGPEGAETLTFNAIGFMRIAPEGMAAKIGLTMQGEWLGAEMGIEIGDGVTYLLELNTTGSEVTYTMPDSVAGHNVDPIEGSSTLTISAAAPGRDAGSYLLFRMNGTLTLLGSMTLEGEHQVLVTPDSLELSTDSQLVMRAGSTVVAKWNAKGGIYLGDTGAAAALEIQLSQNPSGSGFSMGGDFTLFFNATGEALTVGGYDLEAGYFLRVRLDGYLSVQGMRLEGIFGFVISDSKVAISVDATLALTSGGNVVFGFDVLGAMQVDKYGLAAAFDITITENKLSEIGAGLTPSFAPTGKLRINTTNRAFSLDGVSLSKGVYAEVTLSGSLKIESAILLEGDFTVSVSNSILGLAVDGDLKVLVPGSTVTAFKASVDGYMQIRSNGLLAAINVSMSNSVPSALGFSLSGSSSAQLRINTTPNTRSVTVGGKRVRMSAGTVEFSFKAKLKAGAFTFNANILVEQRGRSSLKLSLSGKIKIFSTNMNLGSGWIIIYRNGTVGKFTLNLPSGKKLGVSNIFEVKGKFKLTFNTRSSESFGISASSFQVDVSKTTVTVGGLKLSGSLQIKASGSASNPSFKITIPKSDPLKLDVLGIATVGIYGSLSSSGKVSLSGTANFKLGSKKYVRLDGKVTVSIGSNTSVAFSGKLYLFGKTVGSINQKFGVSSGKVKGFSFKKSVNIGVKGYSIKVNGKLKFSVGGKGIKVDGKVKAKFWGKNITFTVKAQAGPSYSEWFSLKGEFKYKKKFGFAGASVTGSFTATVYFHSNVSKSYIKGKGKLTVKLETYWKTYKTSKSFSVTIKMNGSFSVKVKMPWWLPDIKFKGDLGKSLRSSGSDLVGGYGFVDTEGDGTWSSGDIWIPVDESGELSYEIGDPLTWVVGDGYGFYDENDNGVWDQLTEARVYLDADGTLPDLIELAQTDTIAFDPDSDLGLLAAYGLLDEEGTYVGGLDSELGQIAVIGGSFAEYDDDGNETLTANEGVVYLDNEVIGSTDLVGEGQIVFFDTNGNGVVDDFEVQVVADEEGNYAFATETPEPEIKDLGLLALYDTNGNGVLDPSEGSLVITGGTDRNTGEVSSAVLSIDGSALAAGASVVTPLTPVITAISSQGGLDYETASALLGLALGIPDTVELANFDPSSEDAGTAEGSEVLRAMSQVESLLKTGSKLLSEASGGALASSDANSALLDALAQEILNNDGSLDLTDAATVSAIIANAASGFNFDVAASSLDAVAIVTAALNSAAVGYAANSVNVIRDLARIDLVIADSVYGEIPTLLQDASATDGFVQSHTGAALETLLANAALVEAEPPVLQPIENPSMDEIEEGSTLVGLDIDAGLTPIQRLSVAVETSNSDLLPEGSIEVLFNGEAWTLVVTPVDGVLGSSEVTVTVSDGESVSTQTFTYAVSEELPPAVDSPVVDSLAPTNAVAGEEIYYLIETVAGTEGASVVITPVSEIPAWMTFVDNGDGTASLTGTPSADLLDEEGLGPQLDFRFTVTDSAGGVAEHAFSVIVSETELIPLPDLEDFEMPDAIVGQSYSVTLRYDSLDWAGFTVSAENLPAWLSLQDNGDGSITLIGTPELSDVENSVFRMVIQDEFGQSKMEEISLLVAEELVIDVVDSIETRQDTTTSVVLTIEGDDSNQGELTITSDNEDLLPTTGLRLTGSGSQRILSITPVAGEIGTATLTLSYTLDGRTVTETILVTVNAVDKPVVVNNELPIVTRPVGEATLVYDLSAVFGGTNEEVTYEVVSVSDSLLVTSAVIEDGRLVVTLAGDRAGLAEVQVVASTIGAASGTVLTASSSLRFNIVPSTTVSGPFFTRDSAGRSFANFYVELDATVNQSVSVDFATLEGSAVAGVDYLATSGTVIIPAGSSSGMISIQMLKYNFRDELTFGISLGKSLGTSIGDTDTGEVEIPVDHVLLYNLNENASTVQIELRLSFFGYTSYQIGDSQSAEEDSAFATLAVRSASTESVSFADTARVGTIGQGLVESVSLSKGSRLLAATSLEALSAPTL